MPTIKELLAPLSQQSPSTTESPSTATTSTTKVAPDPSSTPNSCAKWNAEKPPATSEGEPWKQSSKQPDGTHPNGEEEKPVYQCFRCRDQGFYVQDLRVGQPGYGKAIRCECRYGENEIRRNNYLRKIDGLSEEERALRFWDLNLEGNQPAVRQIQEIMMRRTGLITLTGKAGTGKTSLMICAVNQARQGNVPAVYTTVTDLLDYLRAAYAPHTELSFDARWELLVNVDVLAVDELDEFNTTPWAMERFERLVDERWRALSTKLTLFATNSPLDRLPEKVASRLRDGRSQWCRFDGMDMRPLQSWGDRE